jgi:hypothetical protein
LSLLQADESTHRDELVEKLENEMSRLLPMAARVPHAKWGISLLLSRDLEVPENR